MPLRKFGFIVPGAQLAARMTMTSPAFEMVAIGVASPAEGPAAARQLVAEGVELIELCGGFGPVWTAQVLEAIDHRVPVGAVGYGPEALPGLTALFG